MPKYSSKNPVKSGIPLGGIGAGKLEILPNGTLDFFTFLNNPENPIASQNKDKPEGVLGYHFAIFLHDRKRKIAKLLQTQRLSGYQTVERIDYEGLFPFARLNYYDRKLPLQISLEASSFFIPNDENNSALPFANFIFKIMNPTKEKISSSLLITGRNISSAWAVGRFNQINDNKKFISLDFKVKKPLSLDSSSGVLSIAVPKNKGLDITYLSSFNMQKENFIFNSKNIDIKAWDYLSRDAKLPNISDNSPVQSESVQWGGAIAVKIELKPAEEKEIPAYFCWNFPNSNTGHIYSNRLKTTSATMSYVLNSSQTLPKANLFLRKAIAKTDLPDWFKDALLNNLYPFISSSYWSRRDEFELLEAPLVCPLMGTLDVRFYGSIATLLFFPRLELKALSLFAKAQRPDGYIPHDLGRSRFDLHSNGTTHILWKDLNPKFILMAYRDFLWTKNIHFLRAMYPSCEKALNWTLSTDKNHDFLPDDEGQDQTFDLWAMYGASSYVSGIFLTALKAMQKMAVMLKDNKTALSCEKIFSKAQEKFIKKLWNKSYFVCYNDNEKINFACTSSQLIGQWYAHLLDLGYIVDKSLVRKALKQIFSLNANKSKFGAVNAVLPSGKIDNSCAHSKNVWLGINYALCSLAIYEGFTNEAFALAKKVWDNVAQNIRNPWNQPDMVDAKTGKFLFGDHYMREMVIWAMPLALSRRDKKIKQMIQSIRRFNSAKK